MDSVAVFLALRVSDRSERRFVGRSLVWLESAGFSAAAQNSLLVASNQFVVAAHGGGSGEASFAR